MYGMLLESVQHFVQVSKWVGKFNIFKLVRGNHAILFMDKKTARVDCRNRDGLSGLFWNHAIAVALN